VCQICFRPIYIIIYTVISNYEDYHLPSLETSLRRWGMNYREKYTPKTFITPTGPHDTINHAVFTQTPTPSVRFYVETQ